MSTKMSNAKGQGGQLSGPTVEAAGTAGELLIRAAAVLGKLTAKELEALSEATEGKLPGCLAWALEGAASVSQETMDSLSTHPPAGWNVRVGSAVHVGFKGST